MFAEVIQTGGISTIEVALILLVIGAVAATAYVFWSWQASENPPGCGTPRSYDVVCDGLIYRNISQDSMNMVVNFYRGRKTCEVFKNC